MRKIAVIADDLTGAADTGVLFVPAVREMRLLNAAQFTGARQEAALNGVAVCTDTRSMSALEAERVIASLGLGLKRMGDGLIYKKIDSCLRGHVAVELLSLLTACDRRAAVVAPAYPGLGRKTIHDVHYVNEVPVAQSEAGQDPVRPVTSSLLSENLSLGHDLPVGKLGINLIRQGEAVLAVALESELEQGKRLIAVDAESDEDLSIIATTILKHFPDLILSGSAGLARAITAELRTSNSGHDCVLANCQGMSNQILTFNLDSKPLLFVGGSASTVLRSQLENLAQEHHIDMVVLDALEVLAGLPQKQMIDLHSRLKRGSLIVCLSSPSQNQKKLSSQALARALGCLAAGLVIECSTNLSALFASGGDTAQAVLDMLGNPELLILCELAPGFIVSKFASGEHCGMYYLTKSGSFGDARMLTDVYRQLK